MSHSYSSFKHRSKGRSAKKREQEHKYRCQTYIGITYPLTRTGKTQAVVKDHLSYYLDNPRFEKAVVSKHQDDGSWKVVETILPEPKP